MSRRSGAPLGDFTGAYTAMSLTYIKTAKETPPMMHPLALRNVRNVMTKHALSTIQLFTRMNIEKI